MWNRKIDLTESGLVGNVWQLDFPGPAVSQERYEEKPPSVTPGVLVPAPEMGAFFAALSQQFEYRLRLDVGLGKHGHRRLDQDLVLHEADHLLGHVRIPDAGLGSLQVFGAHG